MRTRIRVIALGAAIVTMAGIGIADAPASPAGAPCSRDETRALVHRFVRALNRGELARLDAMWAAEPDFSWYFVDDERERDAENRRTLVSYFQTRILMEDRVRIRRLYVAPDGENFSFVIARTTTDPRPRATGRFHGKGAVRDVLTLPTVAEPTPSETCRFVVWAMDNDRG